jgi:hypothetical protein
MLMVAMVLLMLVSLLYVIHGEIIQNFPSDLLQLKLLGAGKILIGIYLLLLGNLIALMLLPMRMRLEKK